MLGFILSLYISHLMLGSIFIILVTIFLAYKARHSAKAFNLSFLSIFMLACFLPFLVIFFFVYVEPIEANFFGFFIFPLALCLAGILIIYSLGALLLRFIFSKLKIHNNQ